MPELVRDLLQARDQRMPLAVVAGLPGSVAEAYQWQRAHAEAVLTRIGGRRIGYKIGGTTQAALDALGLSAPFRGPAFSSLVLASPAELPRSGFFVAIVETEFAFRLAHDLPARPEPYTPDEVAAAVGAIIPAIEIADSRLAVWATADARAIIADLGYAGALVLGAETPRVPGTGHADLTALASHPVSLAVDGTEVAHGSGGAVLNGPFGSLVGLVNELAAAGTGLAAGEIVSSGTCTPPRPSGPGRIRADFGPLGTVEVALT